MCLGLWHAHRDPVAQRWASLAVCFVALPAVSSVRQCSNCYYAAGRPGIDIGPMLRRRAFGTLVVAHGQRRAGHASRTSERGSRPASSQAAAAATRGTPTRVIASSTTGTRPSRPISLAWIPARVR